MPRYKLTIAYDGTDFHGWQKQFVVANQPAPPNPGIRIPGLSTEHTTDREQLRTVQGIVEQTVRQVLREPVNVVGASRTDAGVHALGQVAALTSRPDPDRGVGWPADRSCDTLVLAINSKLPPDVLIQSAEIVGDQFDPISGAVEKEYTYSILSSPTRPLWDRRMVYHTWHTLDAGAMQRAAAHLVGTHDFASFTQVNHGRKTTVRTVFVCEVEDHAQRLVIRIRGDGFLYNMIRIIAGTLVDVGRGRLDPDAVPRLIAAADRTKNHATTLPPNGLRLEWIRY